MAKISHERLLQVLDYDPATGIFRWKIRGSNRIHVGDQAGVVNAKGYRFITVDRQKLQATRLAWLYVHGEWPQGDVKILNGNPDDSSLANLQPMSRLESARLRGAVSTNTSGLRGVSRTPKGRWQSHVTANYKQINLGAFKTPEEASAAYEHAMAILAAAKTPEECDAAADVIIQHRRKRVAWSRLTGSGRRHDWRDFESFSASVGRMESDQATIAAMDESKPIGPENFRWLVRTGGKFDQSTKAGRAAYMRAYREANPGRWRHKHLMDAYKIDEVEYHRMRNAQGGICLICEEAPLSVQLAVDHCHTTGAVRGLLCKQCNYAMGQFRDDPARIRRAAQFLEGDLSAGNGGSANPLATPVHYFSLKLPQEFAGHG